MLKPVETPQPEIMTPTSEPTGPTTTSRSFWIALILILILAAALRLVALGSYPQEFNQDEMVLGYDAWSIWTTGHDQHGKLLPIYFRTFNDDVPPVANYLTAPFVGILGLNPFNTLLPFALLGIATVFLVALLGHRWWRPEAGLVAALLLAVDPWHIIYSRVAYPASLVPFFTAAALYTFTRGVSELRQAIDTRARRWAYGWLAGSAVCYALLAASYTTMKLEAPLLLAVTALAAVPFLWKHKWITLGWLSFCALCVSPLLYSQLRYWSQIQVHFNQISITNQPNWIPTFFGQYLSHYNPWALLVDGLKGGIAAVRPAGVGELFWLEIVGWLAAAVGLWQQRKRLYTRLGFSLPVLLLGWFLIFPISSSLTNTDIPHEVRAYNFVPLPELLAGFGFVMIWQWLSKIRLGRLPMAYLAGAVSLITLLVFETMFLTTFFGTPLLNTATTAKNMPFNIGLEPVLQRLNQEAGPCDSIWIEPGNQTYIYYLFDTRFPPAQFQQSNQDTTTQKGGWLYLTRFNNIHFGIPGHDPDTAPVLAQCQGQPSRLFFATHTINTGPEWQELISVKNSTGDPIWRLMVHQ